jgi:hypothetical protein
MTLTGYKGLPQGSVLSPFLYNLLGSGMDRFVSSGCDFLQYADIVVYSSHHVLQIAHSAFFFRFLDSQFPLQSWRWYYSLGGLRFRVGLMTDYCHKW